MERFEVDRLRMSNLKIFSQSALIACGFFFAVAILLTAGLAQPAAAQTVVAIVNGDPITAFDIDQRTKLTRLSTRKTPKRQDVLDELINERLKIHAGRRYKLSIPDKNVDSSYASMAKRMNLSAEQLTQMLRKGGVHAKTLKERIRADLTWQQLVRGKYQSSFRFRDKDVLAALDSKTDGKEMDRGIDGKVVAYDYVLQPILFIVPKGAPKSAFNARRREAEAMRSRFQNCEEGLRFARALRNVIVRNQVSRNSSDLPAALRDMLKNTGVGRLTTPETTPNGIQVFAICDKRETKVDAPAMRKARQELFAEQFKVKSDRLLDEIRRTSLIEMR